MQLKHLELCVSGIKRYVNKDQAEVPWIQDICQSLVHIIFKAELEPKVLRKTFTVRTLLYLIFLSTYVLAYFFYPPSYLKHKMKVPKWTLGISAISATVTTNRHYILEDCLRYIMWPVIVYSAIVNAWTPALSWQIFMKLKVYVE